MLKEQSKCELSQTTVGTHIIRVIINIDIKGMSKQRDL